MTWKHVALCGLGTVIVLACVFRGDANPAVLVIVGSLITGAMGHAGHRAPMPLDPNAPPTTTTAAVNLAIAPPKEHQR